MNQTGAELYELGETYEYGFGVKKDNKMAFEYYQKSAEMGNIYGIHKVGDFMKKILRLKMMNVKQVNIIINWQKIGKKELELKRINLWHSFIMKNQQRWGMLKDYIILVI